MSGKLIIRTDISVETLRRRARLERDGRVATRLLAIANALDGMSRAEAARAAGMDRQALRDWVIRFNAEGIAGLCDRKRSGPKPLLDEG
ncbi:helix-turn-helix domain-containing protein, partial [Pleomorphomonas koreensis]|uniref:helix-turn-helix domain-containing protein n=1 Tax=Pleomorphomonas koreensis TaxID=257440 RepID=UPI000566F6A8